MNASTRSYLEGFATVPTVLEYDRLTRQEVLESMGEECADPLLTPWKRGCHAALRAALAS
jgi:hypothetical protein